MAYGRPLALVLGVVLLLSCSAASTVAADDTDTANVVPPPPAKVVDNTDPSFSVPPSAEEDPRSNDNGNPAGDTLSRIYSRCGDSLGCSLWELANVVNGVSAKESLDLFSGLFRVEKKLKSVSEEPETPEEPAIKDQDVKDISIDVGAESLASSVERFLKTHIVHLTVSEGEGEVEGRANGDLTYDLSNLVPEEEEEEARRIGRSKLRRFLIPLLIGFKLKAGFLFPLFFSVVAIIALKALGAGLTALLLASVLGLKAIVDSSKGGGSGSGSKISVEVVKPHPVSIEHQYHHGHHHSHPVDSHWGWGRDGDDQAYRGYYYGESRK